MDMVLMLNAGFMCMLGLCAGGDECHQCPAGEGHGRGGSGCHLGQAISLQGFVPSSRAA